MAKVHSQALVIDASVARAAGPENARHPTAKNCRDFLLTVLRVCHRMTFTAAIKKEWNQHQSGFARRWRVSMFARKKIDQLDVPPDETFREQIEQLGASDDAKAEMLKDAHLIEAAWASGMRVVSLDDVREHFRAAATTVGRLRSVCWLNPDQLEAVPINWLETGAPAEDHRCLGHSSEGI